MRRAAALFGDRPIVSRTASGLHRYRYSDMLARACRLAVALADLGIKPGDRVATLAPNHHLHLEAYFAVPSMGAILHTLNINLHPRDLTHIVAHAGDRLVIVDEGLLPLLEQITLPACVERVIVMDGPYEDLIRNADPRRFDFPEPDDSAGASMCYTSGTTGRPRGVVYTHKQIALQALNLTSTGSIHLRGDDVVMALVPMFHINGWCLPFACAFTGATLVLPGRSPDARRLVDLIASERVTLSAGVPTIWLGVLHALDSGAATGDLSSLRTLIVGGSAVPKALIAGFKERYGVTVLQAWGMTETTSIATVGELKQGRPVPFVETRARNESGLVPWDGVAMGELEVRGPTVATEYYNEPESADRFTDDGWFRSGDIVTIDAGGSVELCDRSKDLIRSGGEWISSVAVENALMGHPAVAEAAVIAMPDETWGERPLAAVVLHPGTQATGEDLRAFLAPDFAKWWLPDRFEFVNAIPRTSTGKFQKSALRDAFANRTAVRR
jgi:fatty-acyl-CoA synthase